MTKDWTGNSNSTYMNIGASNHTDKEREEHDYYATDPIAAKFLIELEKENLSNDIWECAAGEKHLSNVLEEEGYNVISSDLIVRMEGVHQIDFLECTKPWKGDIITNPPYKYASEFIEKSLELVGEGKLVCMFLKIQFLETKGRKELFLKTPPRTVYVSSGRILCAKNADFEGMRKAGGSAIAYAWYVWEKGYKGDAVIKWFN